MPASLSDTHCHLDQYDHPTAIIDQLIENDLQVVCMALSPNGFEKNQATFGDNPRIHVATGLIPQEIEAYADQIDKLMDQIGQTRFIGEVGLDYVTTDESNRTRQRHLFDRILESVAAHGDRILSIHSRRAAADVFSAIGSDFPGIAILHWYSGPIELVESAPTCIWFSVNTAMVTSRRGKAIVRAIPADRMLLETDGPYIQFSNRPAEPRDLAFTVERIAALRGSTKEKTREQIAANWQRALNTNRDSCH